jgi:biotin carboxyl carrier protein
MFRNKWLRMVLVLTVLASLVATPLLVSAQESSVVTITAPVDGATVSGVVAVTGVTPTEGYERWDLLLFPGGNDSALATIHVTGSDTLGSVSFDLDTTKYPDGTHVLALRAKRSDTSYTDDRISLTFANAGAVAPVAEVVADDEAEVEEAPVAAAPVAETAAPVAETAAPVNGFDAEDGVRVSGTVTVTGYANTVGFDKWQLDVIPFAVESDAIFVALGEEAGEFNYVLDTTQYPDGDHQLRLRVVNNTGNYSEEFLDVTIANEAAVPAAAAPVATTAVTPTVAAAAPAPVAAPTPATANGLALEEGATVSGTVTVTGYADRDGFQKWDLYVFPNGNENEKIFIAQGTEPGAFSVTIDTTMFPNGDHVFALRVVDATTGNYDEIPVSFTIANAQ